MVASASRRQRRLRAHEHAESTAREAGTHNAGVNSNSNASTGADDAKDVAKTDDNKNPGADANPVTAKDTTMTDADNHNNHNPSTTSNPPPARRIPRIFTLPTELTQYIFFSTMPDELMLFDPTNILDIIVSYHRLRLVCSRFHAEMDFVFEMWKRRRQELLEPWVEREVSKRPWKKTRSWTSMRDSKRMGLLLEGEEELVEKDIAKERVFRRKKKRWLRGKKRIEEEKMWRKRLEKRKREGEKRHFKLVAKMAAGKTGSDGEKEKPRKPPNPPPSSYQPNAEHRRHVLFHKNRKHVIFD
ncbi:uncharacterized protein BKCO1_6400027 [Diplodia corticola]|uniref:F-box domain-containing protein n=1 Tax=Diplodia corticola TaxID=236234 RepID=A0A1J9RCJ6_9PEZI|nr:uncharacterized protein BKCO1_6400027 [Diplodia corticola]OJD30203.1 hypothetical protein BKCO1_6400027 [Diplodia corticola]